MITWLLSCIFHCVEFIARDRPHQPPIDGVSPPMPRASSGGRVSKSARDMRMRSRRLHQLVRPPGCCERWGGSKRVYGALTVRT